MTEEDPKSRYIAALKRVIWLRREHETAHAAVLAVVADLQGQALLTFHREAEKDPAGAGVRYHTVHKALNEVWARLKYPEARIQALENPPVKGEQGLRQKVMGVVRGAIGRFTGHDKVGKVG